MQVDRECTALSCPHFPLHFNNTLTHLDQGSTHRSHKKLRLNGSATPVLGVHGYERGRRDFRPDSEVRDQSFTSGRKHPLKFTSHTHVLLFAQTSFAFHMQACEAHQVPSEISNSSDLIDSTAYAFVYFMYFQLRGHLFSLREIIMPCGSIVLSNVSIPGPKSMLCFREAPGCGFSSVPTSLMLFRG